MRCRYYNNSTCDKQYESQKYGRYFSCNVDEQSNSSYSCNQETSTDCASCSCCQSQPSCCCPCSCGQTQSSCYSCPPPTPPCPCPQPCPPPKPPCPCPQPCPPPKPPCPPPCPPYPTPTPRPPRPPYTPPTPAPTPGGYSPFRALTAEDTAIFQSATNSLVGVTYEPLLVSTQIVNGTNYLFIALATVVNDSTTSKYYVSIQVEVSTTGEVKLGKITPLNS